MNFRLEFPLGNSPWKFPLKFIIKRQFYFGENMFTLTEEEVMKALNTIIAECDAGTLAFFAGEMAGGECCERIVGEFPNHKIVYDFTPNELYSYAFGEVQDA
jgi:hypothetical protein